MASAMSAAAQTDTGAVLEVDGGVKGQHFNGVWHYSRLGQD